MDPKQQASFIPKKPIAEGSYREPGSSVFGMLATLIFVVTVLVSVGYFGYNYYLTKKVESMNADLQEARKNFQPALIAELARIDARIVNARQVLNKHVSASSIFDALEALTVGSLRFLTFEFGEPQESMQGSLNLKLTGIGRNFNSVALQSDIFARERAFKNPIFSGLALVENGNVEFEVSMSVDPALISYKNTLAERELSPLDESADDNTSATTTAPTEGDEQNQ